MPLHNDIDEASMMAGDEDGPRVLDLRAPRSDPCRTARTALEKSKGLVVINEVQHAPDLFKVLRVLIGRDNRPGQFLLLGSASLRMRWQVGELLWRPVEVVEIATKTAR